MIELRWYKEKAGVYRDGIMDGNTVYHDAVLQYRTLHTEDEAVKWSEWMDVPTICDK